MYTKKYTTKHRIRSQRKTLFCHRLLYCFIDNIRKDNALVNLALETEARDGRPPRKRVKRATRELHGRLRKLCEAGRDGTK